MLKGKVWKGILAALLAFSMLPTVALAAAPTVSTVDSIAIAEVEGTEALEVTGKITKGASVTVLVLRGTSPAATIPADLANTIYIDQAAGSDASIISAIPEGEELWETHNQFAFRFIPREGIQGKCITAWVGGTNVSAPDYAILESGTPAPKLVPRTWNKGDEFVIFDLKNAAGTEALSEADATTWWNDVQTDGVLNENAALTITAEGETLGIEDVTLVAAEAVLKVAVTTATKITNVVITGGATYKSATYTDAITAVLKAAPTLTIAENTEAGENGAVTVTVTGETATAWLAAVNVGDVFGDYTVAAKAEGESYFVIQKTDATDLFPENATEATYAIEMSVPVDDAEFEVASVEATIKNPAAVAMEAITGVAVAYAGGDRENGDATLVVTGDLADVAWTVDGADFDVTIDTISRTEGFEGEAKTRIVPVVASYTKDGFTFVKNFTVTVNLDGFAGVEITIGTGGKAFPTFVDTDDNANVAQEASFTLSATDFEEELVWDGVGAFKYTVIEAGDYTLTINRPGYVEKELTVTFTETEYTDFTWPAMEIAKSDEALATLTENLGCQDVATAEVKAADLNGDNKVTLADYNIYNSTAGVTTTDAEAITSEIIMPEDAIYTGDVFEVTAALAEITDNTFGGVSFTLTYDEEKVELCKADGSAIAEISDAIVATFADGTDVEAVVSSYEAGTITITLAAVSADTVAIAENACELVTFYFKALACGATGLALTVDEAYVSRAESKVTVNAASQEIAPILSCPIAPAATALKIALQGEPAVAVTELNVDDVVVPFYTFNNGITSNDEGSQADVDTTTGDISEIVWLVDGEAVTANEDGTLTITEDMVDAVISYTVLAKADRTKTPNVAETAVEVLEGDRITVSVPEGYKPVVTANSAASLKVGSLAPTFAVGTNLTVDALKKSDLTVVTEWYLLDAAQKTAYEAAENKAAYLEELEALAEDYRFASTDTDKFGVAIIKVSDAIGGGDAINADPFCTAAYSIAKKSSNPPVSSGPSLAPSTPATPSDKPTTPDKDEEITPDNPTGDPSGTASGIEKFKDIPQDKYAWAIESIDILAKAGIIKGMTEDTFAPEETTTQAQLVAMIVRALDLKADNASTTLVAKEHWSYPEVAIADKLGILSFYEGKFDPDAAIVRDQMFAIAYKALNAAKITLKTDGEEIAYTDASSIGAYAKDAVEALTKAGITNGMGDGTLAPKGTTTRAQSAKVLGLIFALK